MTTAASDDPKAALAAAIADFSRSFFKVRHGIPPEHKEAIAGLDPDERVRASIDEDGSVRISSAVPSPAVELGSHGSASAVGAIKELVDQLDDYAKDKKGTLWWLIDPEIAFSPARGWQTYARVAIIPRKPLN